MKFKGDIDIDLPDRSLLLTHIKHVPASQRTINPIKRHASGVYVTPIPVDPVNGMAAIDYAEAEKRGYFKLDLLNVYVYSLVRDEAHLKQLMREPDWSMLHDPTIVSELVHLNGHYKHIRRMPQPIKCIEHLAMFLALIRPAKNHLIGKPWDEVAKTVWAKDADGEYSFKHSHSISYSMLVAVHMNLLKEKIKTGV